MCATNVSIWAMRCSTLSRSGNHRVSQAKRRHATALAQGMSGRCPGLSHSRSMLQKCPPLNGRLHVPGRNVLHRSPRGRIILCCCMFCLRCATSQSIVSLCADSPAFTTAWSWPCLACWVFGTPTPGATRPYFASNAISIACFASFAVQPSDESGSSTNTRLFGLNGCGTITLGITQLAGCPFLGCEVCGGVLGTAP